MTSLWTSIKKQTCAAKFYITLGLNFLWEKIIQLKDKLCLEIEIIWAAIWEQIVYHIYKKAQEYKD